VGAELFHADKHMTKLIVTFRNFVNMPKIGLTHRAQFAVCNEAMGQAQTKIILLAVLCFLVNA